MWVRFDVICGRDTQIRLFSLLKPLVQEWEKKGIVSDAILTYHFHVPRNPSDSLYVCLDIPSLKPLKKRSSALSEEIKQKIHSEIKRAIERLCAENQAELKLYDYEYSIAQAVEKAKVSGTEYYRGAPKEEILRFASTGTRIAFEIIDSSVAGYRTHLSWLTTKEKARELWNFIIQRLNEELGEKYPWLAEAVHFVCNPLLINEGLLWNLATR